MPPKICPACTISQALGVTMLTKQPNCNTEVIMLTMSLSFVTVLNEAFP